MHQRPTTREGWTPEDACKRLEDAGADVVGLNCSAGRRRCCRCSSGSAKAVSTATSPRCRCRTGPRDEQPTLQSLRDPRDGGRTSRPFPTALDPFTCNRYEIADFGARGARPGRPLPRRCAAAPGPHHIRALAEALGRTPEASRYSADMSKHAYLGTDASLQQENLDYAESL